MSQSEEPRLTDPSAANETVGPLEAFRLLRSASKALFVQAGLHTQLSRIEWQEEKSRLSKLACFGLLGFASALCMMVFAGGLSVAFAWETPYRVATAVGVIAIYAIGLLIAWHRIKALSALGAHAFAATRAELAMDIAMIRSKL